MKFQNFKEKHEKLENQKQLFDNKSKNQRDLDSSFKSDSNNKNKIIKDLELKLKRENLLMKMSDFQFRVVKL